MPLLLQQCKTLGGYLGMMVKLDPLTRRDSCTGVRGCWIGFDPLVFGVSWNCCGCGCWCGGCCWCGYDVGTTIVPDVLHVCNAVGVSA